MELAETDNLDEAVQLFKKLSRSFAITKGKDGALLFDGVALIEVQPKPVQAIDTLGAGDMFAGAFLYALSEGMSFHQAGDLASLASAKIVTQFGPRLRAKQTRTLLESFTAGN
jgi:sugar/nucleoside kinase (ribokinase family)